MSFSTTKVAAINNSISFGEIDCAICQDSILNGLTVKKLKPCNHRFHGQCLKEMAKANAHLKNKCPVCKGTADRSTFPQSSSIASLSLAPSTFSPFNPVADLDFSTIQFSQPLSFDLNSLPAFPITSAIGPLSDPLSQRPFNDDMPLPEAEIQVRRKQVSLTTIAGIPRGHTEDTFDGVVKINVPENRNATNAADFIILADVSSSMEGFKIEQLKRTLNWTVDNLTPEDRMCLIAFNDRAMRKTKLSVMDTAGKALQTAAITGLIANGGTNIGAALDMAANVLQDRRYPNQVTIVKVITDGQDPNAEQRSRAAIAAIAPKAMISFVGLGDDHDARLLSALGAEADGQFVHCPDADSIAPTIGGFIGATKKVTAVGAKLVVDVQGKKEEIRFPFLTEGQEHYTPFTAKKGQNPYVQAELIYTEVGKTEQKVQKIERRGVRVASQENLVLINKHINRKMATEALRAAADESANGHVQAAKKTLETAIATIRSSISAEDPLCVTLIEDCTKAIEKMNEPNTNFQATQAQMLSTASTHGLQSAMYSFGSYAAPSSLLGSQSASFSTNLQNWQL